MFGGARREVGRILAVAENETLTNAPIEPGIGRGPESLRRCAAPWSGAPDEGSPGRQCRTARSRRWPVKTVPRSRGGCSGAARRPRHRTNDSMSPTNGGNRRPRPWMLAEREPPRLTRSTPVCFPGWPRFLLAALLALEPRDQFRPLDSRFGLDQSVCPVQVPRCGRIPSCRNGPRPTRIAVPPIACLPPLTLITRRSRPPAGRSGDVVDRVRNDDASNARRVQRRWTSSENDASSRAAATFAVTVQRPPSERLSANNRRRVIGSMGTATETRRIRAGLNRKHQSCRIKMETGL